MTANALVLAGSILFVIGFWLTRPAKGARASLSLTRARVGFACALAGLALCVTSLVLTMA